jgi:hypothetical protein
VPQPTAPPVPPNCKVEKNNIWRAVQIGEKEEEEEEEEEEKGV